jgi:hypothetical protein
LKSIIEVISSMAKCGIMQGWENDMSVSVIRFIARIIICGVISYTTVSAAPGELAKGKENSVINLNLPQIIYAVPEIEMNVYFDNVTLTPNISNFIFDVSCEKGLQQNERWTYIPSDTDAGDYLLSITVLDSNNKIIDNAQSVVRVVPKGSGKGQNLTFLCIGDSLTHASVYTKHLLESTKSDNEPNITLVGSHFPTDSEGSRNRHEGYGGWTAQRFVTHYSDFARQGDYKERGSPFLYKSLNGEPALDFQRYCKDFNNSKNPDFVTIFLGCNEPVA